MYVHTERERERDMTLKNAPRIVVCEQHGGGRWERVLLCRRRRGRGRGRGRRRRRAIFGFRSVNVTHPVAGQCAPHFVLMLWGEGGREEGRERVPVFVRANAHSLPPSLQLLLSLSLSLSERGGRESEREKKFKYPRDRVRARSLSLSFFF